MYLYLLDIFFTFCSKKYLLNFQIHRCLFNLQIIEHSSGNKTVQRDDKKITDFSSQKTQVDIFFLFLNSLEVSLHVLNTQYIYKVYIILIRISYRKRKHFFINADSTQMYIQNKTVRFLCYMFPFFVQRISAYL